MIVRWSKVSRALSLQAETIGNLTAELASERTARAFVNQRLAELKIEHERAIADLRRRLSVSQANFEWLSVSHNRIDADRAALFKDRLHIGVAPIRITNVDVPDVGAGVPHGEVRDQPYPDNRMPGVADLAAQGLSFEDVGDREASALSLESVNVYDDPTSLIE